MLAEQVGRSGTAAAPLGRQVEPIVPAVEFGPRGNAEEAMDRPSAGAP